MLRYLVVLAILISLLLMFYTTNAASKDVRDVVLLFGGLATMVWAAHHWKYTQILAGIAVFIFLGLGIYENQYGTPGGVFQWLGLAVAIAIGVAILGKFSGRHGSSGSGRQSGSQAEYTLVQCTNYNCGKNFFKYVKPGQSTTCPHCYSYVST